MTNEERDMAQKYGHGTEEFKEQLIDKQKLWL